MGGNILISQSDPTPMGDLCRAIRDKDLEAARLALSQDPDLVNNLNTKNCSPINLAVAYNSPEIVSLLLESGENVDHPNQYTCTYTCTVQKNRGHILIPVHTCITCTYMSWHMYKRYTP